MSHFSIRAETAGRSSSTPYCAFCEHCADSLLVTDYNARLQRAGREGVWRFNWLPVHSPIVAQPGPGRVPLRWAGRPPGSRNLYIAFNGYWPEKGAGLQTCTFKEFEPRGASERQENGVEGSSRLSAGTRPAPFAHLSALSGYPVSSLCRACACPRCGTLSTPRVFPRSQWPTGLLGFDRRGPPDRAGDRFSLRGRRSRNIAKRTGWALCCSRQCRS